MTKEKRNARRITNDLDFAIRALQRTTEKVILCTPPRLRRGNSFEAPELVVLEGNYCNLARDNNDLRIFDMNSQINLSEQCRTESVFRDTTHLTSSVYDEMTGALFDAVQSLLDPTFIQQDDAPRTIGERYMKAESIESIDKSVMRSLKSNVHEELANLIEKSNIFKNMTLTKFPRRHISGNYREAKRRNTNSSAESIAIANYFPPPPPGMRRFTNSESDEQKQVTPEFVEVDEGVESVLPNVKFQIYKEIVKQKGFMSKLWDREKCTISYKDGAIELRANSKYACITAKQLLRNKKKELEDKLGLSINRREEECRDFLNGKCFRGTSCMFKH